MPPRSFFLRGGNGENLMRRVLTIALFVVIFLVGLAVMLYPAVSDYYNSRRHILAIDSYITAVKNLSLQDYDEMLQAAHDYNRRLLTKQNRFVLTEEDYSEYRGLLDPTGLGIMGTMEIEVINVRLPIYHGTNEGVLQIGLGHLEGSSLPVGGPGTHSVITGHRGLPSSTLLQRLDRIIPGDVFRISALGEKLAYRVDQIIIVKPHETSSLVIVPDADYCTIVTCTPYAINTHRLLVRGYRIANTEADVYIRPSRIPPDARTLTGARAAMLLVVPVIFVELAILFIRLRRVYGRGKRR